MNPILARAVIGGAIVVSYNVVKHVFDNKVRDTVSSPAMGGIVYCDLLTASHSGVYVGDGKIVHLDGSGVVVKTSAKTFLKRLDGWNTARSIYTFCKGKEPVGIANVSRYAEEQIGRRVKYNLAKNNCHWLTAGCLLGGDAPDSYLSIVSVKNLHDKIAGNSIGRVWRR